MAKHRELATVMYANTLGRSSASKIWRTVVFAGAMLVTPIGMGCGGGGGKKAETTPPATETQAPPAADNAAADEAAKKEAADKEAAAKQTIEGA